MSKHCIRNTAIVALICITSVRFALSQGIITTEAGTTWTFPGNGGQAINGPLGDLYDIAKDASGNIFVADSDNQLIIKISPDGTLTVVAGNGLPGYSGDGESATSASLFNPRGIGLDAAGNVYIADTDNNAVRKVSTDGIITTIAGNGEAGFSGDGGQAINALLDNPADVEVTAAGNIYIADRNNNRVRKISSNGTISTIAGNNDFLYSGDGDLAINASIDPQGLAIDATGNIYIADRINNRIRKVGLDGIISTVAGDGGQDFSGDGGLAVNASLAQPFGVAVDTAGNLFITDSLNDRIRRVSSNGIISTVAGNGADTFAGDGGQATAASLNEPTNATVDAAGNLYIADTFNRRVRHVATNGIIRTIAGNNRFKYSGDGGNAVNASLSLPSGMDVDGNGNVYVADTFNHRIRKITPSGIITTAAGNGIWSFSGDGGTATNASLGQPMEVAVDSSGNLYIADAFNNRIRKVTANGVISTVAGGGTSLGDGGLATSAELDFPSGVAVDGAGNIYIADTDQHRVRKVASNGVITTIAGDGFADEFGDGQFTGDGGQAVNASLNYPQGVALDTAGNLYIADTYNHRVRKVTPGGIITTVAGNGDVDYTGEGGQATLAALGFPRRVVINGAGNMYIADTGNNMIRRVSSGGIITRVAGDGYFDFFGDGGPATGASLANPRDMGLDAAGNLHIVDTFNDRIRKVLATAPTFSIDRTTLTFSGPAGTEDFPPETIGITSSLSGLLWTAETTTASGGDWLSVSQTSGSAPGTFDVLVNGGGLIPGTYQGTVTIRNPLAAPASRTIGVTFIVQAALPPRMEAEPSALLFEAQENSGQQESQTISLRNTGGSSLNWTAQARTVVTGQNWLSVTPTSGNLAANDIVDVQVSVNVTGLRAGVYSGSIRFESAGLSPQTVAVSLLVTPATKTIELSQRGLLFRGVEGGGAVPTQAFSISNTESGTLNWIAEIIELSESNWLSVTPASGTSTGGSQPQPSRVQVTVNTAGLAAGQYSGEIRITAAGANNSPQSVTVIVNVLPAGSNPGIEVSPRGLLFVRRAGTSSPGSQTVQIRTAAPGNLEVVALPGTFQGGNWLDVAPRNLIVSRDNPGTITIQPTLGLLTPKDYFGAVTLLFSDQTSQTVNVSFVVTAATAGTANEHTGIQTLSSAGRASLDGCLPKRLLTTVRTLGSNFASPAGWPSRIEAQVKDDCDNPVTNAFVAASFSNGDAPALLVSLGDGLYEGTWTPVSIAPVRLTLRAELAPLTAAEARLDGSVTTNAASAPIVNRGGVINAASSAPGEAVAPGTIVSVYGSSMAQGLNIASQTPLATTLGGATLIVGGIEQPLFFTSSGQINAQIPFELAPNSRPQIILRNQTGAATAISVPETITIAENRPGIFTMNQQGTGQGAILISNTAFVAAPAGSIPGRLTLPARRGEYISIYSTGLGAIQPAVLSGAKTPDDVLSWTVQPVEVKIGGVTVTPSFAGLAPGFVGLYQVNAEIPAGVAPGSEVTVILTQNGVPSNTTTIAVE